jgi:hypothetical protein
LKQQTKTVWHQQRQSRVGCTGEGQSLDGQKQIQFSLTQKGSNENWEVTDNVSGDYYNIEKSVHTTHDLKIIPKKDVDYKTLAITLRIGKEIVEIYEGGNKAAAEFYAHLNEEGYYGVVKENFIHQNENDTFWGEDIWVIIEHPWHNPRVLSVYS